MANTASARKRIRQTEKRTMRNRARRSRVRTFLRKVELAISGGDQAQAQDAFRVRAAGTAPGGDQGRVPPEHGGAQAVAAFRAHQGHGRRRVTGA